jgi:hypothetical protein
MKKRAKTCIILTFKFNMVSLPSINFRDRFAQEVGGRKSRDIMHSFAVPQEAGPTDFGFLDRVSLSFNVALSFLHEL